MIEKRQIHNFLRRTVFKNKESIPSRILARYQSLYYPKYYPKKRVEKSSSLGPRIAITACSDIVPEKEQPQCGDYWVKYQLTKEFEKLGYIVSDVNPDVIIHLFGSPIKLPKNTLNIAWVYSHPNWVNPYILKQYDKIFCLSSSFAEKIKKWGFDVELMIGATDKKPVQRDIKYDIVFVGNTHSAPERGKIIQYLGRTSYNFRVWGKGWKKLIPEKCYGGQYFDNRKLSELYASSLISLNNHHEDMAREGFVAVRVFDILASGGFCISDKNSGIEEIFGDTVPQYESPKHLEELINFYIKNLDEREKLMEKGKKIVLSHTWRKRAEQFLTAIDQ